MDVVYLDRVGGSPNLSEILPAVLDTVAYSGFLAGRETTPCAARRVISHVGELASQRDLRVSLCAEYGGPFRVRIAK
jgi:hypothetical protein